VVDEARLVAAVVDRLTFGARIIETGTESFRPRAARTGRIRKRRASAQTGGGDF
jgi:hypothetical protein